jgi:dihydrofolate reductase
MTKVYCDVMVSADGFTAGPNQTAENPFGEIDLDTLEAWRHDDRADSRAELDVIVDAKAFIMGRNMFGPVRGKWTGDWRGWWGSEPPYRAPVFVLTHHDREPVEMEGGTTFHFVTDGIESALERAREAAGDGDISIAGGASTWNQFLAAGLMDEVRLHIAPFVQGSGTRLFEGVPPLKLEQVSSRAVPTATHLTYRVVK